MAAVARQCYWAESDKDVAVTDNEPLFKNNTLLALDNALAAQPSQPSKCLGFGSIGRDARTLWLKFRWCLPDDEIQPRIKRIFRLGTLIEDEIITLLKMVPGVTLYRRDPATGGQFFFSLLNGHFVGFMDGCIVGIPESPKKWHVLELKSFNDKNFKAVKKDGIQKSEPEYYAQCQMYMGASGMDRCLVVGYNKSDSEMYVERVRFDKDYFDNAVSKATGIIFDGFLPVSSYPNREWHEAKYMSEETAAIYWGDKAPKPNCRNCRFSSPVENGNWKCNLFQKDLGIKDQVAGCDDHNYLPVLVPARSISEHDGVTEYITKDGFTFYNCAEKHPQAFSSAELYGLNVFTKEAMADENIAMLRDVFNARIT